MSCNDDCDDDAGSLSAEDLATRSADARAVWEELASMGVPVTKLELLPPVRGMCKYIVTICTPTGDVHASWGGWRTSRVIADDFRAGRLS